MVKILKSKLQWELDMKANVINKEKLSMSFYRLFYRLWFLSPKRIKAWAMGI